MASNTRILLEVCVDDVAGLNAAIEGGADRIELCSALALGGLTPSAGLMSVAARSPVPCYAMIRPRAGDFTYTAREIDMMTNDIFFAASAGLAGVVFGASLPDGRLDAETLRTLCDAVGSMPRTLHRAFDLVPDLAEAIDLAVECGFERILTSGRKKTAPEGLDDLAEAVRIAGGRISIMPGAGINLKTIEAILARLDVTEVHSSCSANSAIADPRIVALGFSEPTVKVTDVKLVRALKTRLKAAQ
ncbi:copper homeostasis protein CutC [Rhizobium sp. KVB221]|uniref:PF03932 family protein CutC n=1 Tax=Rhizobium setariae TaxID=2801340 RepID=A0A936YPX4_9HYPH|nr:copper homeostasis protein CutC [Rhizobium setariae]MBL0372311.1 copper homeostasis protein CutC [Rhizobium setariae]